MGIKDENAEATEVPTTEAPAEEVIETPAAELEGDAAVEEVFGAANPFEIETPEEKEEIPPADADEPADGKDKVPEPAKTEPEAPQPKVQEPDLNIAQAVGDAVKEAMKPEPTKEEAKPEADAFNFEVPDAILNGINSEDPAEAKGAINALANGVANATFKGVMERVTTMVANDIPTMIQSNIAENAQRTAVHQDFYGTYPELNNPELYPFVAKVGQQVMAEMKVNTWTPEVKVAIATKVLSVLKMATGEKPKSPTPAPTPKPKYRAGQGTRPTDLSQEDKMGQDILDVLDSGF